MVRRRSLILLPVLLVAACGGTGAATNAPGATTSTTTTDTGAVTTDTGTTAETTAAAGDTDWCLNTAPEVEAALHVTGVVASGNGSAGLGGGCTYSLADGSLVHAVSVINSTGFDATFDAGKQTPGVVEISGMGKGALLMSPQGPLVILTDKGLISMGPVGPAELMADAAAYRTAVETLGKAAVARMP